MIRAVKLRQKSFTYDKQDRSSTNEVAFEALFHNPFGSVDIQCSQDLVCIISIFGPRRNGEGCAYVIQNKGLG